MVRVSALSAEKERAKVWYDTLFKTYESLPFSFRIGEMAYHGFNDDFHLFQKKLRRSRSIKSMPFTKSVKRS